jgi:FixJ family two-component response regulator
MATLAEQLVNVQQAIEAAESAQSVTSSGRSRTMADLKVLYDRERDLLNRIALGTRSTRRLAEF